MMRGRRIIKSRKDIDFLFNGFKELKAISWIASPKTIHDFFKVYKYDKVELLMSEEFSEQDFYDKLRKGEDSFKDELTELIESGSLKIFIPNGKGIHSKMYLLSNPASPLVRVINGSLNLNTVTQKRTLNLNYVWYDDLELPVDDGFLQEYLWDYDEQFKLAEGRLFLGELSELIREKKSASEITKIEKVQIINDWLDEKKVGTDVEYVKFMREIGRKSIETLMAVPATSAEAVNTVFTMKFPENTRVANKARNSLSPIITDTASEYLNIDAVAHITLVQESCKVPYLHTDWDNEKVHLIFNGRPYPRTEPLPENREKVREALENIENFIGVTEMGKTHDILNVKISMYEVLLYMLSSPFAGKIMELRTKKFGTLEGPPYLFIYGDAGNGKTPTMRYGLQLISGKSINPISAQEKDFNFKDAVDAINNAYENGTEFPIFIDDVGRFGQGVESVAKSQWESRKPDQLRPQLILTSNKQTIPDWLEKRCKRIIFDIKFDKNNTAVKEYLNRVMKADNQIFLWFSWLFIMYLKKEGMNLIGNDDLSIARLAMHELYNYAGKQPPEYFPDRPLEEIYDYGRKEWQELYKWGKVTEETKEGQLSLRFLDTTMSGYEINEYKGKLPPTIKADRKGNTLIIRNPPADFYRWVGKEKKSRISSFFSRFGLRKLFVL